MAVDAELIGSEGFNLKFKNYLRDFFIYQFKERGSDFKIKGTNDKCNVNKDIIDGTFYPDAKRLQHALEQSAGVSWNKGDFVDLSKGDINKKRENKRVECITVDMRHIESNPFFSLYQLCSESALNAGTHFSFIYTLLLYFHIGKGIKRSDFLELDSEQKSELNDCLKELAENIESEARRHKPRFWEEFGDIDKENFALEAIDRFSKDHYGLDELYNYMILNKKRLVYNDGNFSVEDDNSGYIEKNVLFDIMQQYGLEVDEKQFGNKMQELTRLGVIKAEKRGQRIYYALSDAFINDLFNDNEDLRVRFSDCVYFFSQTGTLGEIGSYILSRLPQNSTKYMRFKHNYIKRALNAYNNIDLLYAIKNNLWAVVEYRNASLDDLEYQQILCYPIEIRESVTDGRQYLIYYHPVFRSVSAVRIEFIDSIILGTLAVADHFNDDMVRAKNLIDHTWGTAFDNFQEGNVKIPFEPKRVRVMVSYSENEEFIKARLHREVRNRALLKEIETDEFGHCMEIVAEVANPWEMLQWLRSYITRVVTVEINGKEFSGFTDDVIKTYESYIEPTPKSASNISSRIGKSLLRDEVPEDFVRVDNMHSLLFNEIFSTPYNKLGEMLLAIINEGSVSKERLEELKKDYSDQFVSDLFTDVVQWDTEDKRREQAEGFIHEFVKLDGNEVHSVFALVDHCSINKPYDLLPLTTIEIQWLKNILSHPLAKCFLSESEITNILAWLGDIDLFDVNSVVLHDQYIGVEEFYRNSNFGESIKEIIKAIKTNKMVTIKYRSQYGRLSNYICSPEHIEYSKRDNRIRIRAVSETNLVRTFNLERILDVIPMDETFDKGLVKSIIEKHLKENERELVIFFNETKNVPDRILTEFSCFKKKCVKWGSERYRMSLYYSNEDNREILVRLLSYGSLINVFNDTGDVRHELIERIEHQLELTNSMDSVLDRDYKEKE